VAVIFIARSFVRSTLYLVRVFARAMSTCTLGRRRARAFQ